MSAPHSYSTDEFEKWWATAPCTTCSTYEQAMKDYARQGWMAARILGPSLPQGQRNAIIEECAKVCDALFKDHYEHSQKKWGAKECGHAIRGLKRHDATGDRHG